MTAGNTIAVPSRVKDGYATVRYRDRPIQRLLVPIVGVTVVLSQVFAGAGNWTVAWVTAFTFASFLLVKNGPAWVVAPILIGEMTLYGFLNPMFGVAQRFVITGIALIFALPAISRSQVFSDRRMRRVLLPGLAFILIVTVMNFQHSADAYVFQYLRYQIVQLLMLIITASVLTQVRDIKRIAAIVAVVTTAIALVVIWQHYAPSTALYGVREGTAKGRAVGLTNSPVAIANQLIFALVPMIGVLLSLRFRWTRNHLFMVFATFATAVALNYTYTRSAVFALAPALVVMGFLFGGRHRVFILGAVILGVIAFFALENTGLIGDRYYETSEDDRSAATHEALQDVSLAIALDNSISGIGHEAFTSVALEYVDAVDDEIYTYGGASAIGQQQPHNDFLNVWLSWGIFALIAFLAIYLGTLRNLMIAARSSDPFMRGLAIGCAGGLLTYGINSFYHNSLDSSMALWLYAGLSVAFVRLAHAERVATRQFATAPSRQPVGQW